MHFFLVLLPIRRPPAPSRPRTGSKCYCLVPHVPHAVENDYLKYSWEYFVQKNIHNIFISCGRPGYFRKFYVACWAGQTGRELPNIFPYLGSQNTLGKENAFLIFGIFRPLQINHVCDNFRPHGIQSGNTCEEYL